MMGIPKDDNIRKRRKIRITFNEEEDVINPEVIILFIMYTVSMILIILCILRKGGLKLHSTKNEYY